MSDEHQNSSKQETSTDDVGPASSQHQQAFEVLLASTVTLTAENGHYPTASQVRLDMKRRTYGGFNPEALGYKRFRDFLQDASARGFVTLDADRQGDISVAPAHTHGSVDSLAPIRRDVWKAFVDWTPDRLRFYDLENARVVVIPKHPVPLEPERFSEVRARQTADPANFLEIQPISVHQQLNWMRSWAADVASGQIRSILDAALNDVKPIRAFNRVLRELPAEYLRNWKRAFQQHVRTEIESWVALAPAGSNVSVYRTENAEAGKKPSPVVELTGPEPSTRTAHNIVVSWPESATLPMWSSTLQSLIARSGGDLHATPTRELSGGLRERVHAAIDRMSLEEVKKLNIPIGYLFED